MRTRVPMLLITVVFCLLGLCACGQKGPLQRPDTQQVAEYGALSAITESGSHDSISLPERSALC
ncbi:LPS translocon maturation chaperone LptM [Pseudohongiella sp. O18]|uniref:LPS translocon maturation chaperone LptM n=1 Tax=Pseudohongiella sp. O18 TaxID=2904248 RepID=UPI000E7F6DD0|nr:lipoprotein [Pseudohongiella sp. O18]HBN14356.1 hypothetical protein [Pseudohongiella sp.]